MKKNTINSKEDYLSVFKENIRKEAFEKASDIRKFEIDLYWKRASYFWAFIAAIFAGYFLIQKNEVTDATINVLICCIGLIFSIAWYFVNRGSKYWHLNWERHVDLLEDSITGPLYKTTLNRQQFKFFNLTGAYPFSPTKINDLLSLYVVVIWIFLIIKNISYTLNKSEPFSGFNILIILSFTFIFIIMIYKKAHTSISNYATSYTIRKSVEEDTENAN